MGVGRWGDGDGGGGWNLTQKNLEGAMEVFSQCCDDMCLKSHRMIPFKRLHLYRVRQHISTKPFQLHESCLNVFPAAGN